MSRPSSPFPSCYFPSATSDDRSFTPSAPLPSLLSGNSNLTTCLYHTDVAVFSMTWSQSFLGAEPLYQPSPPRLSLSSSAIEALFLLPFLPPPDQAIRLLEEAWLQEAQPLRLPLLGRLQGQVLLRPRASLGILHCRRGQQRIGPNRRRHGQNREEDEKRKGKNPKYEKENGP